jgi:lipopolysaccharide biosynthesis regulator YciM
MVVDFVETRWWIDFGLVLLVAASQGFNFWDRRNKVTQEAVAKLRSDFMQELNVLKSDLETRRRRIDDHLEGVKTRLSDTPTRLDLSRLYEAIGDVSQVANQLRGTVESLQGTISLINQHLLEQRHA